MKTVPIVLLLTVFSIVVLQSHAMAWFPNSGWNRIKHVEDYYSALENVKFAIAQHNRQTGDTLEFVYMYRGYISGKYYKLYFQAKNTFKARKYETIVLEKVPNKVREVIYFKSTS